MKIRAAIVTAAALVAAVCFLPHADAQRARRGGAPTPETLYNDVINGDAYWKNAYTGEDFAWHTVGGLHRFVSGYDATGDTAYLDAGVKFYDALLARMATGPDGYKGFIGPFEFNNKYWCDDHVADALMFDGILDFSFHVMRDSELRKKYGDKAMEYVNAAKRDFFEKWDSRGTYHEDGPFGVYVAWDHFGLPNELTNWKVEPACEKDSNISLPFNKQIDCGAVALRIWQITGEEKYKHKAEQLFGYMKSRMFRYQGAMHWNYWEPAGQWDLGVDAGAVEKGQWNPEAAGPDMRMWIDVHPHSNYQENESVNIMKAYNAGIVFTEQDLKDIIHTNLKVMWNGDKANPQFANSDVDLLGQMGNPDVYHRADAAGQAGTLWTAYGQVDGDILALSSRRNAEVEKAAPSFKRRDVKGAVEIPAVYAQFPLGEVRTVHMAAVLPSHFAAGEKAAVVCKLLKKEPVEVALYSPEGKDKLAVLKQGEMAGGDDGREGVCYFFFDGTLPGGKMAAPGEYRIRWTVADGYREFPITVQSKN